MAGLTQYFIGWEFMLNGTKDSDAELRGSHVSKAVAMSSHSYTELRFEDNGTLVDGAIYSDGKPETEGGLFLGMQNRLKEGKHSYQEYELKHPHEFILDKNGINYLGGKPPVNFSVPKPSSGFPVQYLGLLNRKDSSFNLAQDLHLVAPLLFDWTDSLWLDYKNPLSPIIINDDAIPIEARIDNLEGVGEFSFEKINFSTSPWPVPKMDEELGNNGVPTWVQYPEFQNSPTTGLPMDFVCQLWGIPKFDGCIYVFYCRESKVVCYLYQGT